MYVSCASQYVDKDVLNESDPSVLQQDQLRACNKIKSSTGIDTCAHASYLAKIDEDFSANLNTKK